MSNLEGTTYSGPVSRFDDSRFINASTLEGLGEKVLTIKEAFYLKGDFKFENGRSLGKDTLCLRFNETHKVLKLNATNRKTCQKILGSLCGDWPNKRVKVFMDPTVRFGGKAVGGVVIKEEVVPVQSA